MGSSGGRLLLYLLI